MREEELDSTGNLKRALVISDKYVESDTALVNRVIGKALGGKQNLLVFNDEAHHAYRIRREDEDRRCVKRWIQLDRPRSK